MNKFFTGLLAAGAMVCMAATAQAAEYIAVKPVVNYPSGTYPSLGNINISWPGVKLQMNTRDKDLSTPVSPSYFELYNNGTRYTAFGSDTFNGGAVVKAQQGSNEQSGGGTFDMDDELIISLPDMAFFWKGSVKLVIKPGAVTSVAGAINEEITLEYNLVSLIDQNMTTWNPNPADGTPTFEKGEGAFYASWLMPGYPDTYYKPVKIASNPSSPAFYQATDGEVVTGGHVNAMNLLSIEGNNLKVDVSSLPAGHYSFTLPEGVVDFGDYGVNWEAFYDFIIRGAEAPAPEITPAPGRYANFNSDVTIFWEGYEVSQADQDAAITVKMNGVVQDPDDWNTYWSWSFVDADGNIIYSGEEDPAPASGIQIQLPYGWSEDGSPYVFDIEIPEGMFSLVNAENSTFVNSQLSLQYEGVQISDELTLDPERGSKVKSLKSFTLVWDEYTATLNPDCAERIEYGPSVWGDVSVEGYATIVAKNGVFTITLDKEYTTDGYVGIEIPEGMFLLETAYGQVPSPSVSIQYEISRYVVVPGNFAYVYDAMDSFTIYAEDLTLTGAVENIEVYDTNVYDNEGENPLYTNGASYEAVSDENGSGIKVTFAKAYDVRGSIKVVIPAGTFTIEGQPLAELTLEYYIQLPFVMEYTATPASESTVDQLETIKIVWGDSSELEKSWMWDETPFTLAFTALDSEDTELTDITDNVEIVTEEEEDPEIWWPVVHSTLVIGFDSPYTAEGMYEIYVPAGYVAVGDYEYEPNTAFTLVYYIGESSNVGKLVAAEEGIWTVYSLNGVCVLRTADEDALRTLAPGIYVINGKKVIVK